VTRLFAYARVSTLRQRDAGTIENQKLVIRKYCEANGVEVAEWFEDDGVSAFGERPKLREMLERVDEVDGVIVSKLDRIARSPRHLLEIVDYLASRGKAFVVVSPSIDTSTPVGKFMLTVLGAVSELEASIIRERMAEGRARAREQGVKFGRKPLEFSDEELALMRQLYEAGVGMDTIAKVMSAKRNENIGKWVVRDRLSKMDPPVRFRKPRVKRKTKREDAGAGEPKKARDGADGDLDAELRRLGL